VAAGEKQPGALLTIGELSNELGVAQHILRYWETRFPQLRPMQRAGNRRYYRPADVDLVRRIHRLLNQEGYTVRGVQKLLRDKESQPAEAANGGGHDAPAPQFAASEQAAEPAEPAPQMDMFRLIAVRNRLADALGL
jgi:DNA-binding transcriptional MerR regulator